MIINKKPTLKTIKEYLFQYRGIFYKRSHEIFMLIIIAMITMQQTQSVRFLFDKFISKHWNKSLNSFYYFLKDKNHNIDEMIKVTIKIAKSVIEKENSTDKTVYLSIDDTLVPKYGDSFECKYKLFDHANKTGSRYINGHCIVSMTMTLPVSNGEKSITIPLGYKVYEKPRTKLELAKELIKCALGELDGFNVVVLCDSWYTNSQLLELVNEYENLNIIGAVRSNTVLYGPTPEKTGKRGRPRKMGERLNHKNFNYVKEGDYYISTVKCFTNLHDKPVMITVTTKDIEKFKSVRFYLSTKVTHDSEEENNKDNNDFQEYRKRWSIEVLFYQQKTFWSLESYMVRSKVSIEKYINLIGVSYSAVMLIPFISDAHKEYKYCSPQEIKYAFSEMIMNELFFSKLLKFQPIKENLTHLSELCKFEDVDDLAS